MKSLPSWIAGLLILMIWQLTLQMGWIANFLLPSPWQVLLSLQENSSDFAAATWSTFTSTAIGFFLSALLGFSLALLFVSFDWLKRALLPFAIFFQTVPVVSVAPLLVIWFGFGEPTVRASAFIVSFFPVLANSIVGLSNADPGLRELFQAYGAKSRKTLWSLQIPSSLPSVFTGLQISAGLSVIGSIVGEFVAGGGLGGMLDSARTQQRVDLVFAAILLSSVLGMLFVHLVKFISRLLLKARPFYQPNLF